MSKSTILRKILFKASDFIKQEDGICLLGVFLDCNQSKIAIFGAGGASETRIALPQLIRGVVGEDGFHRQGQTERSHQGRDF